MTTIVKVIGREIFDSRGNATVGEQLGAGVRCLDGDAFRRAAVEDAHA